MEELEVFDEQYKKLMIKLTLKGKRDNFDSILHFQKGDL